MPRGMQPKPSPKLSPFPKPTTTTAITVENQDTGVIKKKIKNTNETHLYNHHHKDVLITVYVESASPLPSPSNTQIRRRITTTTDPIKKISPKPPSSKNNPPTAKARGYDRRAQLLAYAQELRNADSKQVQWPRNGSRPKPKSSKGKKLTPPIRLHRTKNGKKYQRLLPAVDISCSPKCTIRRKKKDSKPTDSQIFRKLRGMLKGFCRGD